MLRDVSRFLPDYNGIVQTFATGITWKCGSLPNRDTVCYINLPGDLPGLATPLQKK